MAETSDHRRGRPKSVRTGQSTGEPGIRSFHDLRHLALTHLAVSGASEVALMATAGHRSMATTKRYIHLAGRVFRQEAERLEQRLLGGDLVPEFVPDHAELGGSEATSDGAITPNPSR